jgi:hypothetical protein
MIVATNSLRQDDLRQTVFFHQTFSQGNFQKTNLHIGDFHNLEVLCAFQHSPLLRAVAPDLYNIASFSSERNRMRLYTGSNRPSPKIVRQLHDTKTLNNGRGGGDVIQYLFVCLLHW